MNRKQSIKKPALLDKYHVVKGFDCGSEPLNDFLKRHAYNNNRNNSSRTYVTCKEDAVIGYYTIVPGSIKLNEAPVRVAKGLGKRPIPVILIARLAVDNDYQGRHIGEALLKDALLKIVGAIDTVGGRAVLVHAKDSKAKSFYKQYGFESSPIDEFCLYLLTKDIKKTLGL